MLPTFLTARVRIFAALASGILLYGLLSLPLAAAWVTSSSLKVALSWDSVVSVYLLMAIVMMWRHDMKLIRARAKEVDIGLLEIVVIVALAGAFSLYSVATVLSEARDLPSSVRVAHIAVGVATVFLSWVAMHVIYAVHYAHVFYDPAERSGADKVRGGLEFPGEKEPHYWDFVYFSFVIGMTCQVSDVQVTARDMRHFVTAQGIIAFFYNTVVVALAVNVAASLGGG
jgi:uncharacterized membrane protein